MSEHFDRPKILSEIVGQSLNRRIAQWAALWHGLEEPPAGGRRDQNSSDVIDSEELQEQRNAYEEVIGCTIGLIQRGKREKRPAEMFHEIITNINIMLPDPSYSKVREALFIDILKEVANQISPDKETSNLVDAIQDEVILKLKRPL